MTANPYFLESELYAALGMEKKAGNIAVAESKFILDKLSMTSVEDGYKAVVIWLPERMNAEAANRLLKIVEEPPERRCSSLSRTLRRRFCRRYSQGARVSGCFRFRSRMSQKCFTANSVYLVIRRNPRPVSLGEA